MFGQHLASNHCRMKSSNLFFLFLILTYWSTPAIFSQSEEDRYVFVDIGKEAPQRAITSIVQDNKGLVWIGTYGLGLYKYNGIDFTPYKQIGNDPTTINSSLVYAVFVDASEQLWVGTEAGLNLYDPVLDNFKEVKLERSDNTNEGIAVFSITENKKGQLFIGTREEGLYMLDTETLKTKRILPVKPLISSHLVINAILTYSENTLLIGTNRGLFEYHMGDLNFKPANFQTPGEPIIISQGIESLMLDANKNLWVGTFSDGLIKISRVNEKSFTVDYHQITQKRILALIQSPDGNILCGTENDGLFVMKSNGEVLSNYLYNKSHAHTIKSNSIWSLFVDNQNRVWIGYYNKGVGIYDRYYDKFKDITSLQNNQNSLQSPSVTGIVEDQDSKIWIGIDGGGVDVYDPKNKNIVHLADPKNPITTGLQGLDVQTLFIDSKQNTWVGTWNSGIFYLEKGAKRFIQFNTQNSEGGLTSNSVTSFAEDHEGTIWISTFFTGLHSYDPKIRKISSHTGQPFDKAFIGQSNIRKILVDSNNIMWLGTTKGLYKVEGGLGSGFDIQSMNNKIFKANTSATNSTIILSLFEDRDKNLWIGTDGGGLCKYGLKDESIHWFNTSNGLAQGTVASIVQDDTGNIWIGGEAGLSKLEIDSKTFYNFTINDGLLANDFNYNSVLKDKEGILYFGNYEGINYFEASSILINENEPSLYFSDFKLFNKSVKPGAEKSPLTRVISETEHLTLKNDESVFTIEYAGISYTRPLNNQYAYFLEGFEKNWNFVGNTRSATYTNLSPGDYVFKVKAANNDGVWNESPITMGITVLPPWWATKIAILAYVLLFLLLAYLTSKFINHRLEEKRIIKFERDHSLQQEILNERKIQFFTNISHEFRTPLTLILNPLRDIIENQRLQLTEEVKDKHRTILKNAMRLMRLINELMDFRKLHLTKMSLNASKINIFPFVEEVSEHFQEEAIEKKILYNIETDGMPLEIWGDPGMLEKVIFNMLSNAFKATPENGMVTVGVFATKDPVILPLIDKDTPVSALEIVIEDTGVGINQEEIGHIFERFYQSKKMNEQYYGASGTGIGLEVAQSFIHLHKGKIEVNSVEGEGTRFKITLPFGRAHLKPSELVLAGENSADQEEVIASEIEHLGPSVESSKFLSGKADAKKKTLLLVEDNSELRKYLKKELESEYHIIEAENGEKGISLANRNIPDIIVTDVIMPEMDGFEFCSLIKQDIKTSHIPVLMLTAKVMSDDRVKGIDSGADVYLNKPFEMRVLRSYVNRLISSRQLFLDKFFKDVNTINLPENTTSIDRSFITKVLNYIHENIGDADLNVEHLAGDMHLSRSQLYRKIKAMTDMTANEFIRKIRLEKAKQMLENGEESISEVGFKVGFSSPSYFTKCFKSHFGILPTEVKSN